MAMENLLEALKSRQIEQGLSLRKVAAEVGVTQPYLSMMFAGKRQLTCKTAKKIEQFLKPKPSATLTAPLTQYLQPITHRINRTSAEFVEVTAGNVIVIPSYYQMNK